MKFTILLAAAEEFSPLWPSLNLLLGHDHNGGSIFALYIVISSEKSSFRSVMFSKKNKFSKITSGGTFFSITQTP